MKSSTSVSYIGKEVFLGIDVHKKSYSVVARVDKEVVKKWTTAASPKALAEQIQSILGVLSFTPFTKQDFQGSFCIEN